MQAYAFERQSGIDDVRVSPHTPRHTFSKQYLKRGGDLFKLSRELGHSGVQILTSPPMGHALRAHHRA
jgi:site-specific recombinase XerD